MVNRKKGTAGGLKKKWFMGGGKGNSLLGLLLTEEEIFCNWRAGWGSNRRGGGGVLI